MGSRPYGLDPIFGQGTSGDTPRSLPRERHPLAPRSARRNVTVPYNRCLALSTAPTLAAETAMTTQALEYTVPSGATPAARRRCTCPAAAVRYPVLQLPVERHDQAGHDTDIRAPGPVEPHTTRNALADALGIHSYSEVRPGQERGLYAALELQD